MGWLSLALLAGCSGKAGQDSAWLEISYPEGVNPSQLEAEPASRVRSVRHTGRTLMLELVPGAPVRVRAEGACPTEVALPRPKQVERRTGRALFSVRGGGAQVGFDAPVTLTVEPGCEEARAGTIAWRHVAGPKLRDAESAERGFTYRGRTLAAESALGGSTPWGLVPFSPRTRGETVLEATWTSGDRVARRRVRVSATARSRGIPNVAVGTRVFLGGEGWKLASSPPGSKATLANDRILASFLPEVSGVWKLEDGEGRTLTLSSGRYDETPLDCQRCHAAATEASTASPMTTVLARLASTEPDPDYPACAIACHAVGEPGIDDGGFEHLLRDHGAVLDRHTQWADLPRAARRLGGVGCFACHGPGTIPAEESSWTVLRVGVCAHCHDAPPKYPHVTQWQRSRMATSDRDPQVRERAECARCHTTAGFLSEQGALADFRPAPAHVQAVGITCQACHAAHGETEAETPLLRRVRTPAYLGLDRLTPEARRGSGPCIACHSPDADGAVPWAPSAALWHGRGGLDPATGDPIEGKPPADAKGCVTCHLGHDFRAPKSPRPSELTRRAEALWVRAALRLRHASPGTTPHAGDVAWTAATPLGRAAYDVALVLGDRGAHAHGAAYATELLDRAEAALK